MPIPRLRLLKSVILLTAVTVTLAACGTDAPKRMGTGTAAGAATGATFGLLGGPIGVLVGGAIGGGIGALTASTTTPKQINLDNVGNAVTGPTPAPSVVVNGGATTQPGLRNQIDQYQARPQPLGTGAAQSGYAQPVQSQPLPPPTAQ